MSPRGGGSRVRKYGGLLWFQARSAELEHATLLAALIGWELSVFSSMFSSETKPLHKMIHKNNQEESWFPTQLILAGRSVGAHMVTDRVRGSVD